KKFLFDKLNRKLQGYYNYYGVRGNYKSLNSFVYRVWQLLFKWLNRRSQRRSYNVKGFKELVKDFGITRPQICHDF
ncbi:MAG: group II intron reverse transcriptase/maturase, partial [Methyloprofundus sp.]|nr:group II intron reverse transcriptase/maturase [Methyloprofundus sp.]